MGSISAPMSNTASLSNRGLELNLGWNDQIKDFRYGVGINLAFNKNKVTDFKGELRYELDEDVKDIWVIRQCVILIWQMFLPEVIPVV